MIKLEIEGERRRDTITTHIEVIFYDHVMSTKPAKKIKLSFYYPFDQTIS